MERLCIFWVGGGGCVVLVWFGVFRMLFMYFLVCGLVVLLIVFVLVLVWVDVGVGLLEV